IDRFYDPYVKGANPMQWSAKASAPTGFELPTADNHPAVFVGLIELGRHVQEYERRDQARVKKLVPMVAVVWELKQTKSGSDERHVILERYSFTFGEKSKLRMMLESWRGLKYATGTDIDVGAVLGRPCLIQVVHRKSSKGTDVANVGSVSKLPA